MNPGEELPCVESGGVDQIPADPEIEARQSQTQRTRPLTLLTVIFGNMSLLALMLFALTTLNLDMIWFGLCIAGFVTGVFAFVDEMGRRRPDFAMLYGGLVLNLLPMLLYMLMRSEAYNF
ncbi:MAG: hypothetical protein NUW37_09995 [Planctomycetes bacterium]|nr:hypothetical protein [Planctomycetota bacterium]